MPTSSTITAHLVAWRSGDEAARDLLCAELYDELRLIARRAFGGERTEHTLEPTALVHEAYLRLVHADVPWRDRVHFLAVAARIMRHVLIDHARTATRLKRGSGLRVTLDDALASEPAPSGELFDLDRELQALERRDPQLAQLLELHYFAGCSYEELAELTGLSRASVGRELQTGRAWLKSRLAAEPK